MSTSGESLIHEVSEAGIAAEHPHPAALPAPAAPATGGKYNSLRSPLQPIACWSIGDARFKFSCSFVWPEIAEDAMSLAALVRGLEARHGKRPLASVFGHADPVGNESFNKQLSGRRAAAIYALLTRRTDIWEDIFSQKGRFTSPLSADDWGEEAINKMLADLGYPAREQDNADAADAPEDPVRAFQRDHGLVDDGQAGPDTRKELFSAYMDEHCRSRKGQVFRLEAADFLARGEDSAGKGDYQGCSEFNPLLLFSKEEYEEFSKPEKKDERDTANEPNRRVVVFFFHPQSHVSTDHWPCPRARDGISACRKRLWHNVDERRSPTATRRTFEDGGNTFACRYYERFATHSPCERARQSIMLRIRLFDESNNPLAAAPYRLTVRGEPSIGKADESAYLEHELSFLPRRCLVEWDVPSKDDTPPEQYRYHLDVFLDHYRVQDEDEQMKRRLFNLGYPVDIDKPAHEQKVVVRWFQRDYRSRFADLPVSGELDEATIAALTQVHDGCDPVVRNQKPSDDGNEDDHPDVLDDEDESDA